ncbi:MAG: hypothetical protein F4213_01520 [Boseongicola sp. SB0677_bin_26]|nr:hypothetical protein [Boseongicola sp. SB0665_bin_10]MYG24695.1 hypothetical protein [Boseongicola sp. SB0677_bin_26]
MFASARRSRTRCLSCDGQFPFRGRLLRAGDVVPVAPDPALDAPLKRLELQAGTGLVRPMPSPQTGLFAPDMLKAFEEAVFVRSPRANRQGVRLDHDGAPFATRAQLGHASDYIGGDVQMAGDGTPCVLLADCQTMGGYPRIVTVLLADLPRVAQARAGEALRFRFVTADEAEAAWQSDETILASRKQARIPHARDPRHVADLLAHGLIGRPPEDVAGHCAASGTRRRSTRHLDLRYSRARRTRAGRAESGPHAKTSPAASVAATPPATIKSAETGSNPYSTSITKRITPQPARPPAMIATMPAAAPSKAERMAKLRRIVLRVAPSVFRTAASYVLACAPAATAPISTTMPVRSVARAP